MKGKSKSREGGGEREGRMEEREKISSVFFFLWFMWSEWAVPGEGKRHTRRVRKQEIGENGKNILR